jgi:hypothetical protein
MRLAVLPEYPLPGVAPYGFSLPPRPWLKARAGGFPPGRLPRCVGSLRGSPLVGFGPSSECLRQPAAAALARCSFRGVACPYNVFSNGHRSGWGSMPIPIRLGVSHLSGVLRQPRPIPFVSPGIVLGVIPSESLSPPRPRILPSPQSLHTVRHPPQTPAEANATEKATGFQVFLSGRDPCLHAGGLVRHGLGPPLGFTSPGISPPARWRRFHVASSHKLPPHANRSPRTAGSPEYRSRRNRNRPPKRGLRPP